MADSQEIKSIVESAIAKVFEKRIAELRKDLRSGVGESLGSRVSELQLDVETGVAELFNARAEQVKAQIGSGVGEILGSQVAEMRKDVERGVTEIINTRLNELRNQVEHGMGELLGQRAGDLKKDIERGVSGIFNQRAGELQKEIERLVTEASQQRLAALREELEKSVESTAEKRILELRKDAERVLGEKTEQRLEDLRKDVHRVVVDLAEQRSAKLRQEVERVVSETTEKRLSELRKEVEKVVGEVAENRVASIRKDVEKVVAEAGEQRVEELRADLVKRVTAELEPEMGAKTAEAPASALLASAVHAIQDSTSQTDILRALLDGAAHFSSRVALLVIKSENAAGWQARGFDDNSAIKKVSASSSSGLVGKAITGRAAVSGKPADVDAKFAGQFSPPKRGDAWLVPLVVREKVPALLYADAGTRSDGECDTSALQMLARSAGLWLEILTLRKAVSGGAGVAIEAAAAEAPAQEAAPPAAAEAEEAAEPAAEPEAVATGPEDEIHKKAKRFAKLLVDEIKLYNQQKVNEGRQHRDLYSRLKEDIEKSRASYDKRYGKTAAGKADYFNQEVIRVLAENDVALLGSGFSRS